MTKSSTPYPERLRHSTTNRSVVYELNNDAYALHYSVAHAVVEGAQQVLNDGTVAIFIGSCGTRAERDKTTTLGPVYVLQPGGAVAVPTGLILLRFSNNVRAQSRAPELDKLGYDITEVLSYAPNCAWVRDAAGDISRGLGGISKLETLRNLENVEPQMLMHSPRR